MLKLFEYNWQVREDWLKWCESVPEEELLKKRVGGPGSLLFTLFHIIDVEFSWITGLLGKPDPGEPPFADYATVAKVREFSEACRATVEPFVRGWTSDQELKLLVDERPNGETVSFKHGEIMRHVLAHEIHHIGQLSVWAREIGREPVTANLIRRGLFD